MREAALLAILLSLGLMRPTYASQRSLDNLTSNHAMKMSKILVLSEENPDGTFFISVDGRWPPVRIAVQDLLDRKLSYPEEGYRAGNEFEMEALQLARLPTFTGAIQAPTKQDRLSKALHH